MLQVLCNKYLLAAITFYIYDLRYEGAVERKLKVLDIIRSMELPNNPLDDIIDQVVQMDSLSLSKYYMNATNI